MSEYTAEERETFLRTSDADSDWEICTLSPVWKRRLTKMGYTLTPLEPSRPDSAVVCRIPSWAISIRRPVRRKGHPPSAATLAALALRNRSIDRESDAGSPPVPTDEAP